MSAKALIPVAEFDRLIEPDELRYELDEGELIQMTRPRYRHNKIVMALTGELLAYLTKNPVGELLTSDNLFVLGPTTKRAPDLSFMVSARLTGMDLDQDIEGSPDLVVEVLSPSDTATAMRRKLKQYFAAGCRVAWLVYPETKEIEVWMSAAGPKMVLGESDILNAPEVLPGFSAQVGTFF